MASEVTKEEIKDTIKDATQDAIKDATDATKDTPQKTITTKTETVSEETIDMNRDGRYSKVEITRFLVRPFLITWFSISVTTIALYGIYKNVLDVKETLYVFAGITTTLIGYACGKSSRVDSEK